MAQPNGNGLDQFLEQEPQTLGFTKYLRELPPARVLERFVGAGQRERRILSSAEIERIARDFSSGASLAKTFEQLPPETRRACALAYLLLPEGLPSEETAGSGQQLIESFLVHAVRDKDNNLFYRGFDEFEPALRSLLSTSLREASSRTVANRHAWPLPVHVVNDFVLALTLASSGKLQATKSGSLAKASQVTVRKLLHCGKTHWVRDLHRTIELFTDYAIANDLLLSRRGNLRLARTALTTWLVQGVEFLYADLVTHATSGARPWHWALAAEAFQGDSAAKGRQVWHNLDCLGSTVVDPLSEGAQLGEALGLFCTTQDEGSTLVASHPDAFGARSAAAAVQSAEALTVLPDFSVIIHQECSPAVLQSFCEVGELFSLDAVYRGTISRQAIADSLFSGVAAADIQSRLVHWRAPANVVETVKEWVREFERVSVPDERVVLVSDPAVFQQLSHLDMLRSLVAPVPMAGVLRIKPGHEIEVRQILSSLNFDTRAPLQWSEDEGVAHQEDLADVAERTDGDAELVTRELEQTRTVRRGPAIGKYGADLKELPPTEMDHVIDYAIIMGHRIRFDYDGSPWVKRGEYTIVPESFTKGAEGSVEGEDVRTGTRKRFLRTRIKAIGVLES